MLDEIIARKRAAVAERMRLRPLAALRREAQPTDRSLVTALKGAGTGFILECKRASPSSGVLREHYDPVAIARQYAAVAHAISVLSDEPFFGGSLDHLSAVRAALPLPVLCKDFIIDPYQIVEARRHGADAVLLIATVLGDPQLAECLSEARRLGMDALLEVHDAAELSRALALGATLVGINNRNLDTLEVSLAVTERLAPRIPPEVLVVSESGVQTHADVNRLRGFADAFLVGASLMRSGDVACAARELAYGRVKVCGLGRPEDAAMVWEAGATWGGLNFAPASPRVVSLGEARRIRDAAPLSWVGVFVDAEPKQIAALAESLALSAVQLHGDETFDDARALRRLLPRECVIWKAVPVRGAIPSAESLGVDRVLLDAYAPAQRGGTGRTFDWTLLTHHPQREQMIVAGGLSPDNAAAADALGAWALDVNSGVEEAPRRKEARRVEAFFTALRRGTRRRGAGS